MVIMKLRQSFYPIGLKDGLEFIENKDNPNRFHKLGLPLDIGSEENINRKGLP